MRKMNLLFCTLILSFSFSLSAQDIIQTPPSPIIFIMDASGSMWGQVDGKTKIKIATNILSGSVDSLSDNQKIGLAAYGHRRKGDCKDFEFLVDTELGTKKQINQALQAIKPLGKTPLAYSVLEVIGVLRQSKMKATIILLTDGIESCGGNICDVVKAAKEEGIDFKIHIIGFGLKSDETEQLKCAANSGNGQYFDAADAEGLEAVLNTATSITVDEPSANFSLVAVKNGNPLDVYIEIFPSGSNTQNKSIRTYKDTAFTYLPPTTYDLKVNALENSDLRPILIKDVQSFADSMILEEVSFDAGKLKVTTLNNGEGWDAVITVYEKSEGKSVARGRTYRKTDEYELNPGVYDVEAKALTIKGASILHRFENVEIKANETKAIEHNFNTGILMIGAKTSTELVDAVINITESDSNKSIAGGRTYTRPTNNPKKFVLTPGTYKVTLKALGKHKGKQQVFNIEIKTGETSEKTVQF